MYASDANINLSVERANERRQAVQAYGRQRGSETAPSFGQTGEGTASGRLVLRLATAALLAATVIAGFAMVL